MKMKLLLYLFVFLFFFLGYWIFQYFFLEVVPGKANLLVKATPSALVMLNDKTVGTTPFQKSKIKSGDYNLKLLVDNEATSSGKKALQKRLRISPNSQVVVNWELGTSDYFNSGETLSLEKGNGLAIISEPDGSQIKIDNKEVGLSPLSAGILPGVHKIEVSKEDYITRVLEVEFVNGFRMTASINLALDPKPSVKLLEAFGDFKITHLFPEDPRLLSDLAGWTASLNPTDYNLDFFIGSRGEVFTEKEKIEKMLKERPNLAVGYLSDKETTTLSPEAKKVLEELKKTSNIQGAATSKNFVQVKETPTGFLNVRQGPSTGTKILITIKPGEKYEFLEEKEGWFRIKLNDGSEGWVLGEYVKKLV